MLETTLCPALQRPSLPWLALAGTEGSQLLEVCHCNEQVGACLPTRLSRSLSQLSVPIIHSTAVYDGTALYAAGQLVDISVLMHAYVFFDVSPGERKETNIQVAAYLPDSDFALQTVDTKKTNTHEYLTVDPSDLHNPALWKQVTLQPSTPVAKCGSDVCKLRLNTSAPVAIFYLLGIVHYEGKPNRATVSRHIVLLDNSYFSTYIAGVVMAQSEQPPPAEIALSLMTQATSEAIGWADCENSLSGWFQPGKEGVCGALVRDIAQKTQCGGRSWEEWQRLLHTGTDSEKQTARAWAKSVAVTAALQLIRWLEAAY